MYLCSQFVLCIGMFICIGLDILQDFLIDSGLPFSLTICSDLNDVIIMEYLQIEPSFVNL